MIKKQIKILSSLKNIIINRARDKHIYEFNEIENVIKQFMARKIAIHDVHVGIKATLMLRYNTSFNKDFYTILIDAVEANRTTLTAYINKALYYELIDQK